MTHPAEGTLRELMDGELEPAPRAATEAHVAACLECMERLASLRAEEERTSALLGLTDVAPPTLAAQAAFHRRRRAALRGSGLREALPRAAVLVLLLGGAAVASVVPGSPVREWVEGIGVPGEELSPERVEPLPPPPAPEPSPTSVSIAPVEGRVRVAVSGSSPELRIRVRLAAVPRAEVMATGSAVGARFRTSPGRVEVVGAGPGEVVVSLPAGAGAAYVEVNGRVLAAKEGSGLRALAPRVAGTADEPVFRAGN